MDWSRLVMCVAILLNARGIHTQGTWNTTQKYPSTNTTTATTTTTTTTPTPTTTTTTTTTPMPTTSTATTDTTSALGNEDIEPVTGIIRDTNVYVSSEGFDNKIKFCFAPVSNGSLDDCEQKCYIIEKEKECNTAADCWKLLGYSASSEVNHIIAVMGGVIAFMVIVMISSSAVFLRVHYKTNKKVEDVKQDTGQQDEGDTQSIQPPPRLPPPRNEQIAHDSKNEENVKEGDPNDDYVNPNTVKVYLVDYVKNQEGFEGQVRYEDM